MKSFVISVAIIILLISLTAVNAILLEGRLGDLSERIDLLPNEPSGVEKIRSIQADWKKMRNFLGITVRESSLKDGDTLFNQLECAVLSGDNEGYLFAKKSILMLFDDLKRADIPYFFESVLT